LKSANTGLPDNIINDKSLVIGKIAKTSMVKGDYIFPQKIADFATDEKMDRIIKEDKKLVTVSVSSIAAGLSSHLKSGDIVNRGCVSKPKGKLKWRAKRFSKSDDIP
jgi:pilus assembly protein CpaB